MFFCCGGGDRSDTDETPQQSMGQNADQHAQDSRKGGLSPGNHATPRKQSKPKKGHRRGKSTYDLFKGIDPATGAKVINQYIRVAKLGEGSYGRVALFKGQVDGKLYAIKVLNKELLKRRRVAPGITALEDVLREDRVLKRLRHENVVKLVESINDPGCPKLYIVMDYLPGGTILQPPPTPAPAKPQHKSGRSFGAMIDIAPPGAPDLTVAPALAKIRSMVNLPNAYHSVASAGTSAAPSPRVLSRQGVDAGTPAGAPGAATVAGPGSATKPHHRLTISTSGMGTGDPPAGSSPTARSAGGASGHAGNVFFSGGLGPGPGIQHGASRGNKGYGSQASIDIGRSTVMSSTHSSGRLAGPGGPGGGGPVDVAGVTLNFGGLTLAADTDAAQPRPPEPELDEDGTLLPPFGPLPEDLIRTRLGDVLRGLSFLHESGVAHMDIKPQNLLISAANTVKITDLSCSVEFDPADRNGSLTSRAPGTPLFTAPECCSPEPFLATAADVWSVGVTAFAMAYGRLPYFAPAPFEIYEKICSGVVPWPDYPPVDPSLRHLIARMLEYDPRHRITAKEALEHPWMKGFVTSHMPTSPEPGYAHGRHSSRPHVAHLEGIAESFKLTTIESPHIGPSSAPSSGPADGIGSLKDKMVDDLQATSRSGSVTAVPTYGNSGARVRFQDASGSVPSTATGTQDGSIQGSRDGGGKDAGLEPAAAEQS